ncbi:MAG: S41 family peptidase [Algisphaera sp.]
MNQRLVANLSLVAAMAVLLVTFRSTWARPVDTFDQIKALVDLRYELATEYVEEPDPDELIQGAINGMVSALDDPYTQFLTPEDLASFEESINSEFTGIGAEVEIENNRLHIVTPLEDSPAFKAGVMAGDTVLDIDGTDTLDLPISDAIKLLKGPAGTDVTIQVRHFSGDEQEIVITRDRIEVKTVRGFNRRDDLSFDFWLDENRKIGYVRLTQFSQPSIFELTEAFTKLKDEGVRGLVLDLRYNPGGLLDAAVKLSNMFLEKDQTIVSVRGRTVRETVYKADGAQFMGDIPLVVLANPFSASASEIVSGALSDNNRALFVGERTFGKGSVQQVKMLQDGQGALKITNAYYYLPNGRNIHRRTHKDNWGVDPSEGAYVSMTFEQRKAMADVRREIANGGAPRTDDVTPAWIEDQYKDPQLAAGFTALLGKLDTGDWPTVGQSGAELLAKAAERDNLAKQRESLEEAINEINEKIKALELPEAEQDAAQRDEQDGEQDPANADTQAEVNTPALDSNTESKTDLEADLDANVEADLETKIEAPIETEVDVEVELETDDASIDLLPAAPVEVENETRELVPAR